jgi:hypothetical protein
VNEKLQASADVVRRTVVVALVGGIVVDIKFKTIGGAGRGASRSRASCRRAMN